MVERGAAQIGIDEEDFRWAVLASRNDRAVAVRRTRSGDQQLAERFGNVDGYGGLTVAFERARYCDRSKRLVRSVPHRGNELQERLHHHVLDVLGHGPPVARQSRNIRENRECKLALDLALVLDAVVEEIDEK